MRSDRTWVPVFLAGASVALAVWAWTPLLGSTRSDPGSALAEPGAAATGSGGVYAAVDSTPRSSREPSRIELPEAPASSASTPIPHPAGSLRYFGIVVDESSGPIAGADVRCQEDGEARSTTTDPEGRFELPARHGERGKTIAFSHVGHVTRTVSLAPGRWEAVTLEEGVGSRCTLLQEGGDGSAPLGGAQVVLSSQGTPQRKLVSDQDGVFTCRYPQGAMVGMEVLWGGGSLWSSSFQVQRDRPELVFRVPSPEVRIELRAFTYPDQGPVAGAEVRCGSQVVGITDERGEFSFGLCLGAAISVRVSAPGHCDGSNGVRATERRHVLDIPLVREGALFGRIVDESGAGIHGATVRVDVHRDFSPSVVHGVKRTNPRRVGTDEDGRFEILGLGSSRGTSNVQLVISHPDKATFRSESISLQNGARVGPLEFVLTEGAVLAGAVTLDGEPVSATLFLEGMRAEESRTDDEGRYAMSGLKPGKATVFAYLDEHRGVFQSVTTVLSPGQNRRDFEFAMRLARIRGTVLGSTVALDHCQVLCDVDTLDEEEPASYSTWTDDLGRFEFEVPAEAGDGLAEYTLWLTRWERDFTRTGVLAGSEVTLECAPSARVKLIVIGSEGMAGRLPVRQGVLE